MNKLKEFLIQFIKKRKQIKNDLNINKHLFDIKLKYKESVIIGNGPSLNSFFDKKINFLEEKNLFCVNSFINSFFFLEYKPQYCIFVDPYYWKKNIPIQIIEEFKTSIEILNNEVDWELNLILPDDARVWNWFIEIPNSNANVKIIYFNNRSAGLNFDNSFFYNFSLYQKFPHFQNVLVAALFFSINFGSEKNFLIGADMSLHEGIVVKNNQLCNKPNHFYDENYEIMPMFKDNGIDVFKISEFFNALSMMFKGFEILEEYSKFKGAKVINLTENSFIDSFERRKI